MNSHGIPKDQNWLGVAKLIPVSSDITIAKEENASLVQQKATDIIEFLKPLHIENVVQITCQLLLKRGQKDMRLQRGINEGGILMPDFGKPFLGLYFQRMVIVITFIEDVSTDKKITIQDNVTASMKLYWMNQPTAYSNWEFNQENRQRLRTHNGLQTARYINFPEIIVSTN
jgi:hypothetical protein